MSRLQRVAFLLWLAAGQFVVWGCGEGVALGAGDATRRSAAQELVREALHREIYGMQDERDSLLREALQLEPELVSARWHQGLVRCGKHWLPADDVPQWVAQDRRLTAYERQRAQQPDTVAGHWTLADWCRNEGLLQQERAHLCRLLDLQPDHPQARGRLGYRRLEGRWVTEAEVEESEAMRDATRRALAKWRPKLEDLRDQLSRRGEKQREAAVAAIRAVNDPEAIPAMRVVLSLHSEQCASLVVDALSQMPEQAATESIAWHAVACAWPAVREKAARELGPRPAEAFVPLLLSAMYTPAVSRLEIVPARGGDVRYRHLFLREGQEERQLMVLETAYRRVALPGGDGWESMGRAWADSLATAASREANLARENALSDELNQRIARALNTALDQQLPASPQRWWDWWDEQNSVVRQGEKQTRTVQTSTQRVVVDQPAFIPQMGDTQGSVPLRQTVECFAAGTPVFSLTGYVAIEKIQVGDLVLAQDVETGELVFKPVLRTSVRPREPLFEVQVGNQTFHATRGHPLWVSGRGWVKVGNLQSGMQVHALGGTMPVVSVDGEADATETYNLIVADFHTYFVGEDRVLSHDLSSQRPTRSVVPGLTGE